MRSGAVYNLTAVLTEVNEKAIVFLQIRVHRTAMATNTNQPKAFWLRSLSEEVDQKKLVRALGAIIDFALNSGKQQVVKAARCYLLTSLVSAS